MTVTHTWRGKYIVVCIVVLLLPCLGITVVVFNGLSVSTSLF